VRVLAPFVHLLWIVIALGLVYVAVAFSSWIPYIVGGALAGAWAIWVLVSAISPSKPDRRCPRCGKEGLVKIRRGVPGARCEICGYEDEKLHVAYLDDW
jgi:hypothetical protein